MLREGYTFHLKLFGSGVSLMQVVQQLRDGLRRMMDASFHRELLAACAPKHAPAPHSLDAFEGLFAACLISTAFWLALIAFLSS